MSAYLVGFLQPTNPAFAEYPPLVPPTLEPFDGKFLLKCFVKESLSNGGPEFKERSTADDFKIAVVIEFPTLDKAMAWKNSAEYQAIIGKRLENSTGPLIVCDGTGKVIEGGAGAYCLTFVKVTDPKFTEYPPRVQATLDPYGGEFLVRCALGKPAEEGGPAFAERTTAEDYTIAVLLGFPSVEKLHGWHDSKEYQDIIGLRLDNSTGPLVGSKAF
eukprot:scaffold35273_cov54-Cyclotella_meneghiniana.AAC.2